MTAKLVDRNSIPTWTFDWGIIKPLIATDNTEDGNCSLMHVILFPGKGHDRHNHPESDEILYILSGRGNQMVDDGEPFPVVPGDAVWIPKGVFHSTLNTSYETLVILANLRSGRSRGRAQDDPRLRRGPEWLQSNGDSGLTQAASGLVESDSKG